MDGWRATQAGVEIRPGVVRMPSYVEVVLRIAEREALFFEAPAARVEGLLDEHPALPPSATPRKAASQTREAPEATLALLPKAS